MRVVEGDIYQTIDELTFNEFLTEVSGADVDECSIISGRFVWSANASICMLLSAYNEKRRLGLIGHFSALKAGPDAYSAETDSYPGVEAFETSLSQVQKLLQPIGEVSVALAGAGIEYVGKIEETALSNREYALRRVVDLGIQRDRIQTFWNDVADSAMSGVLNCYDGVLTLARNPSWYMDDVSPETLRILGGANHNGQGERT